MGKVAAQTTRIFIDEFQLSSALSSFSQVVEQVIVECDNFESIGPERIVENYDHNADFSGFYDAVEGAIGETIDAMWRDGDDHYVAIIPGSATPGSWGREGVYKIASNNPSGAIGGAQLLSFTAQGAGSISRAALLQNSSVSAIAAEDGQNVGASTSPREVVITARVISGTFSDLVFDIQDSDDDGGGDAYANLSSTEFTFAAAGVQRKTITATTKAWKRVNITAWTGTSALLVVTIGEVPGT